MTKQPKPMTKEQLATFLTYETCSWDAAWNYISELGTVSIEDKSQLMDFVGKLDVIQVITDELTHWNEDGLIPFTTA